MPAFLITHFKGKGEDILVEDPELTLAFTDGWVVLTDLHGPCLAIPAHAGATITRIDEPQDKPEE